MNSLSPDLRFELTGLISMTIMGQIKSAEDLARACDKLSDLAWGEVEESLEPLEIPPSMRLERSERAIIWF